MSFLNYLFDIHKASKPEFVKNIKHSKIDNFETNLKPSTFKNIKPQQIITTQHKILSTSTPEIINTYVMPMQRIMNVSNIPTISIQNNRMLSTTTPLKSTVHNNTNIIIPQTAFNSTTPYWATDNNFEAIAPIDISNNVISLNNSAVVPGVYTVAEITVDEKGIIQNAVSGFIPPNDDWSNFQAQTNVDMSGFLIQNLGEPVDINDATTKQYVDNNFVNLTTAQDISGVKTFLNIPECATLPINNDQLANKEYVDTEIANIVIDVSNNFVNLTTNQDISGIKTFFDIPVSATLPLNNNQLANKEYVDNAVSGVPIGNYLPLAGGTMAGNIDMSGNDILNGGSIIAGGITESVTFGQALLPMAGVDVYATNVSMNSYNPISAMNFIGVGGVNINAPDNDINLNAGDINLSQTQVTSFMNLTAVGGIVLGAGLGVDITGGGAVAINAGTTIQILAPGNVSIGSGNVAGADTEVEKVGFLDNTIYKAGPTDLEIDNVAKLENTGGNMLINSSGNINITSPLTTIVAVNPLNINQTLTTTFDPANNIQMTINDGVTGTGATIDMFIGGEVAVSATDVFNVTADSANLSITNDLTLSATQTVISGGGIRFNQSRMNANPIASTDYAITYTQVGAFTRVLPQVSAANIGQKYIITNSGIGTLTLGAFGTQLIYSNGTGTNTKVITPSNTYTLTAIQSTTLPLYGWSMVGGGTTPLVWGSFSSTATQTATLANTTYFATYDTSNVPAQNCSFSGAEITITQACSKIRIQSSIIVSTISPTTVFRFWLVKNGVNEPNTNSIISIKDSGESELEICEWYDSCVIGDKYKVAFQSDTAGSTITATAAGGVAPNDYPASPSIITTIQGFQ